MGFFSEIKKEVAKVKEEQKVKDNENIIAMIAPVLMDGETIDESWTNGIEYVVITSKRLLASDKMIESPKVVQFSIPLQKITMVAVETGSRFWAGNWKKTVTVYIGSVKVSVDLYDKNKSMEFFNRLNQIINFYI